MVSGYAHVCTRGHCRQPCSDSVVSPFWFSLDRTGRRIYATRLLSRFACVTQVLAMQLQCSRPGKPHNNTDSHALPTFAWTHCAGWRTRTAGQLGVVADPDCVAWVEPRLPPTDTGGRRLWLKLPVFHAAACVVDLRLTAEHPMPERRLRAAFHLLQNSPQLTDHSADLSIFSFCLYLSRKHKAHCGNHTTADSTVRPQRYWTLPEMHKKWQENNNLRPDEKWTVRRWNKNRLKIERVQVQ